MSLLFVLLLFEVACLFVCLFVCVRLLFVYFPAVANPKQLPIISALVGAGGNLGVVIAGFAFYGAIPDPILPFKAHGCYVMFFALLSRMFYWPVYGHMFHGPAAGAALSETAPAKELEQETKKAAEEDEAVNVE
ncbi:unnamed protein product [Polarella glacialis]|uniref:Uncharacterized protein n=1 Tax=Polarella glacialis TaxID=89957 RepID=A0A813KZ11_POLGL|nr:unnamed protein product [Polarella glacialis]